MTEQVLQEGVLSVFADKVYTPSIAKNDLTMAVAETSTTLAAGRNRMTKASDCSGLILKAVMSVWSFSAMVEARRVSKNRCCFNGKRGSSVS